MARKAFVEEVYIKIAEFVIKIEFILEEENNLLFIDTFRRRKIFIKNLYRFIKNFIVTKPQNNIDYILTIKSSEATFIREAGGKNISLLLCKHVGQRRIETYYYANVYQIQLIIRDIIFNLVIKNGGYVLHGSAIAIKNNAYLFLGESTSGKSTIVRLLKETCKPLADDIVLIKKKDKKYFVYQTPFFEKQWWIKKENKSFELKTIFFICKGKKSYSEAIFDKTEIIPLLLNQIYITKQNKKITMSLILRLVNDTITFRKMIFRKNKKDLEKLLATSML